MRHSRIEAGDTVKLKSGGPTMTVECVRSASVHRQSDDDIVPTAMCVWFDSEFHRQSFRVSSLERV